MQQVQRRPRVVADQRHQRQAAVARDDGRHPLGQFGQHARITQDHGIVVRVDIDEARRDGQASKVQHVIGGHSQVITDGRDAVTAHPDICRSCGSACAIHQLCVAQQKCFHVWAPFSTVDQAQSTVGCWSTSCPWACKTDLNWARCLAASGPRACSTSTINNSMTSKWAI